MIHSILFTGHMIDAKDRKEPRFPAKKENNVRKEIRKYLIKEKSMTVDRITGIAGGACGGDILFHELCQEMNIFTQMYLALPSEKYKKTSVSFAGINWEKRFDRLRGKIPVFILPGSKVNGNQNIWERTNLWMLNTALKNGGDNMSLIALWDGKGGDGEGGTEHMIKVAKKERSRINIININKL